VIGIGLGAGQVLLAKRASMRGVMAADYYPQAMERSAARSTMCKGPSPIACRLPSMLKRKIQLFDVDLETCSQSPPPSP
jgi:hypothetical protein